MKNIKFVLLIGIFAIYSCKKDKIPSVSGITIDPNPVGTTRNTNITASVADADNIQWYIDDSESGNANPFTWKATAPGMHILKLEATSKAGSVTKTDTIDVYDYDFRYSFWGDNVNAVMNSEPNNLYTVIDSGYYFEGDADSVFIAYGIGSSGLSLGGILYFQEYTNFNNYITDYSEYVSKLDLKYGDHVDITEWYDNTYKNDPNNWGMALENALVAFGAVWETSRDVIFIELYIGAGTDHTLYFDETYLPVYLFKSTNPGKSIQSVRDKMRSLRSEIKNQKNIF